jgi:hypothetical protein
MFVGNYVHNAATIKDILLLLQIWDYMIGGNVNALLERARTARVISVLGKGN